MTREERIKKLMEEKMISYEDASKIVDQELMDSIDLPSLTEEDKNSLVQRARKERFKKYANTKLFQDLAFNFQDLAKKEENIEVKEETYDELEEKIANSKHTKPVNAQQDTIDDVQKIVPDGDSTKELTDEQLDAKISRAKHVKVKSTKKAKPKLIKKWKEMSTKKKVLSVVSVLVAAGVIVGIAATVASNLMNGDASGVQAANDMLANGDSSMVHNIFTEVTNKGQEIMDNVGSMISNSDVSTINGQELANVDFSQQQFDPSTLSGQGEQVFTNANDAMNQTNSIVTNEWYQVDGANLISQDGTSIDTAGMTNGQVQELLNTGEYSVATTNGGVGMGFESSDQVLNHMQEASQTGGRTL